MISALAALAVLTICLPNNGEQVVTPRITLRNCRLRSVASINTAIIYAALAPGAQAAEVATTSSIIIEDSGDAVLKSVLRLNFDKPVSLTEAAKLKRSMAAKLAAGEPTAGAAPAATAAAAQSGDDMWCGGSIAKSDARSWFDIQYTCGSPRRLAWGWKLKPAVTSIVVGAVSERGLEWWRNGVFAGQNSPHVIPPDYIIHGNMNPVYRGNDIDYQNYATFRHNLGPGGTGSVGWAGSVILRS